MLDPFTLIIVLTVIHLIATVVMIVVWHVNRSIPGVGSWALGRLFITLALFAFSFRQETPLGFSVLLSNGVMIAGLYFLWRGNLAFMGRPSPRLGWFVMTYGVLLTALAYWSFVEPNFALRAATTCLIILVFDVLCFRALWPRAGDEVYLSGKLLAAAFALNGVSQVVRAVVSLSGGSGNALMESSATTQLALMTAIVMSMVSAMANMGIIMEFLKKDLKRQAERDPLTGAYNRRAFGTIAAHILARGRREGGIVSMVILDLDHFKSVNDRHGHAAGDAVLKRVVNLVQGVLRAQDVLVRLGGEEFAMMLPATTQTEALRVAERIRAAIEAEHFETDSEAVRVTTSLGVTSMPARSDTCIIDGLIKQADSALYQAKDAGRNTVCVTA